MHPWDAQAVAESAALLRAADALDAPWAASLTDAGMAGLLRHGWDGEAPRWWIGRVDGGAVATGGIFASTYDNLSNAWLEMRVHPGSRRRGHGTALLAHLERAARADGRNTLGIDGWAGPQISGFAAARGFEHKFTGVCRRLTLVDLPAERRDALHALALSHAGDYEFVRVAGALPEELLEASVELRAAINDAPNEDLVIEDEVFPAERVRAYERAQAGRGRRLYRVMARHRHTGAAAGHTVLAIDAERPHLGDQHDTSVVRAHRGHRLGLVLKTEMLRWLGEVEPALAQVDTFNAQSNDQMIAVNEAMGFRVVACAPAFQRTYPRP